MADYLGTAGDDHYVGTSAYDTFNMTQGGKDTVEAGAGGSQIDMGATLTAGDRLWGGDGYDIVSIQGDYSGGLTLGANTFHSIDRLQFLAGFDYRLTMVNGNVDPGVRIDLSNDHGANSIWVDASAMTDGGAVSTYSDRPNTIIGSQSSDDFFELTADFDLDGQGGDDHVNAFNAFDAGSRFDGGDGFDRFDIGISFTGTLRGSTIRHVEQLNLGQPCDITFANANVDAGATMAVYASGVSRLDASAETSGHYILNGSGSADTIIGGRAADTLVGGGGDDQLTGGRGADSLQGGDGGDVFFFTSTGDSSKKALDVVSDFDAAVDHIDLSQIDARTDKAGDQAFHLVAKFTHAAGELVLTYDSGANATHVKCDVDGDGKADLFFDVTGHLTDTSGFVL